MDFHQSEQKALFPQNSILSLPFGEFYYKNGKSLGSMKMDEFLASIWKLDNLPLTAKSENGSTQTTHSQQGIFSIPPLICKKTVDEVLSQIQKGQPQHYEGDNPDNNVTLKKDQWFREMSLEDFLVKVGVFIESSLPFKFLPPHNQINNIISSGPPSSIYKLRSVMGIRSSTEYDVRNNISSHGLDTYQMLPQKTSLVVNDAILNDVVENIKSLTESDEKSKRKRMIDGPPEVVDEKKKHKILKNRESAMRSRERKQAYVMGIEAELNRLKQENEQLKKLLVHY
ncbi:hypothetical protein Fmac_019358 [Flemingia macrophylla]|uniref:BZIP domain-containing protein n=1 Tax=Flemingia macrophylla TaxID=520843 RepID=A0ABD1M7N8_9FABA